MMLTVAVLIVLIGGVTMAFLQEGLSERRSVGHFEANLQALEIAETGLTRSELELKAQLDAEADGLGTVSGSFAGGRYEVEAVQDPAASREWVLTASGRKELSVRRIEVRVRVRPQSYFAYGMFANDDLVVNGDITTDAFDSRKGPYLDQAVNLDDGGSYALPGGNIGSNGALRLLGTSGTIRGDAIPGPGYLVDTSGDPTIWGSTTPLRSEIELPPPPYAEFEQAMLTNNNASLPASLYDEKAYTLSAVSDEVIVLEGGTYFFSSITVGAQAQILVKGPCILYVTGSVKIGGGGVVNTTANSANFQLYAHPYPLPTAKIDLKADVTITGGPDAYMAVYAPYRSVTLSGGSDYFGAVIGGDITVGGTASFHYDLALADLVRSPGYTLQRMYWREISSPPR